MNRINLYEFAKKYIVINDGTKIRHFTDEELKRIRGFDKLINKCTSVGYIRNRKNGITIFTKAK
jgi:hypothetical protein